MSYDVAHNRFTEVSFVGDGNIVVVAPAHLLDYYFARTLFFLATISFSRECALASAVTHLALCVMCLFLCSGIVLNI